MKEEEMKKMEKMNEKALQPRNLVELYFQNSKILLLQYSINNVKVLDSVAEKSVSKVCARIFLSGFSKIFF